jgi:hypothetical protein
MPSSRGQTHKQEVIHLPITHDGWNTSTTTQQNISGSLIWGMNYNSESMVSFAWKQNSEEGVVLWSITIPFKNLIKHLPFYPFSPAKPVPSSLVPSSTHSSARIIPSLLVLSSTHSSTKTPDTCPDPNHQLCYSNDIMALDPNPNPWLTFCTLITRSSWLTYWSITQTVTDAYSACLLIHYSDAY